jgi:hypothetical protein
LLMILMITLFTHSSARNPDAIIFQLMLSLALAVNGAVKR